MLKATYQIQLNGKQDEHLKIDSDIIINKGTSRIEIKKNGVVNIYGDAIEKIHSLRFIAQISLRHSSSWNKYDLPVVGEIEELETGKKISSGIVIDFSISPLQINQNKCKRTANNLLKISTEALFFFNRATDMRPPHNELSALLGLTALEIELHNHVPIDDFFVGQKLTFLKSLNIIEPPESLKKIEKLVTVRNKLAHGNWRGNKIEEAILNLLGGKKDDWFMDSGRIKNEAIKEILEEILKALELLSNLKTYEFKKTFKMTFTSPDTLQRKTSSVGLIKPNKDSLK